MKIPLRKGICENCGFRSLVRKMNFVPRAEFDRIAANPLGDAYSRELDICITCSKTPTGCVSENVSHKRLPDEEYLKK